MYVCVIWSIIKTHEFAQKNFSTIFPLINVNPQPNRITNRTISRFASDTNQCLELWNFIFDNLYKSSCMLRLLCTLDILHKHIKCISVCRIYSRRKKNDNGDTTVKLEAKCMNSPQRFFFKLTE